MHLFQKLLRRHNWARLTIVKIVGGEGLDFASVFVKRGFKVALIETVLCSAILQRFSADNAYDAAFRAQHLKSDPDKLIVEDGGVREMVEGHGATRSLQHRCSEFTNGGVISRGAAGFKLQIRNVCEAAS